MTQIDRVVEAAEEALKGHTVQLLAKKALPRLDLPKVRRNRHVEILPLSTGCLGACTYCKTKHARGQLGSYEPAELVRRAAAAAADPQVQRDGGGGVVRECAGGSGVVGTPGQGALGVQVQGAPTRSQCPSPAPLLPPP